MFGAGNDRAGAAAHPLFSRFQAGGPTIPEPAEVGRRAFRTIWISDVHLGTRGCNAQLLIDFLDSTDSETMYLVGDIIDGWRLKKKFYWPAAHNDIVWRILKRAKRGTRIVYIPGNHDEMFRQFTGLSFGGVEIRRAAFHDTADGRRLMTRERAVHRLTGELADFLGIDAGRLEVGARADVAVVDPSTLDDRLDPMAEEEMVGMPGLDRLVRRHDGCVPTVIVNGRLAWHDGAFAEGFGDRPGFGRVLRATA